MGTASNAQPAPKPFQITRTYAGAQAGMTQGFKGTYDQLEEYLASLRAR